MTRIRTNQGIITISNQVYTTIAGVAATNCFGVKGMALRSMKDGLVHMLRRESMAKGVHISVNEDNTISIDLHIMVDQGINIAAVSESIMEQVRYVVTNATGTEVKDVNIFVDSVVLD